MNIEEIRDYCLSFQFVTEEFPFDENTLVFKVKGKMFALMNVEVFDYINLKCDPELAIELREEYNGIKPGFHMNKKHWNSVYIEMDVDFEMIKKLIFDSYQLVVKSLPKKIQVEFHG